MEDLGAALTRVGLPRGADETLERYAARVAESELTARAEVADALRRYAALRYGAEGEEAVVADAVARAARAVSAKRTDLGT
jgi:hypothetical protein